jgi:hypothetical protein
MNSVAIPLWQTGSGGPPPFSASAYPTFVSGYKTGSGTVLSSAITATLIAGTSPYTYSWTEVDESAGGYPYPSGIHATSAASATTTFYCTTAGVFSKTGWFKCTVTDSLAAVVYTNEVEVLLERGM